MSNNAPRGALAAASAFFMWGLFPLFWSRFGDMPAPQVLAHRVVWCAVAAWAVLLVRGRHGWLRDLSVRQIALLVLGGLLISINWGVYVWAVMSGHVIDTSMGYFITPLVSVLIAVLVLRERLSVAQTVAVSIAAAGVMLLAWQLHALPWVALALAASFGTYGLVRKLVPFDPLRGLAVESTAMLLPAVAYLLWCEHAGNGAFLHGNWQRDALLLVGGPLTAIPLVLFAHGAQRVSLVALGLMQYITPTVALLIGILVFQEPFGRARMLAFGCIWLALAVFTADAVRRYGSASPAGDASAAR